MLRRRRKGESGRERPTWVAHTSVRAPVVAALAVFRADVGVAGVGEVASVLHADLQALGHVDVGHVGGRLAHADTLREGVKTLSFPAMARRTFAPMLHFRVAD